MAVPRKSPKGTPNRKKPPNRRAKPKAYKGTGGTGPRKPDTDKRG